MTTTRTNMEGTGDHHQNASSSVPDDHYHPTSMGQEIGLLVSKMIASFLSLVGSTGILICIYRQRFIHRQKLQQDLTYHQLLVGLSVSDWLVSLAFLTSSFMIPAGSSCITTSTTSCAGDGHDSSGSSPSWYIGNQITCNVNATMTTWFPLVAATYNAAIAFYFYRSVIVGRKQGTNCGFNCQIFRTIVHTMAISVGAFVGIAALVGKFYHYHRFLGVCYYDVTPTTTSPKMAKTLGRFRLFYYVFCISLASLCTILLTRTVRQKLRNSMKYSTTNAWGKEDEEQQQQGEGTRERFRCTTTTTTTTTCTNTTTTPNEDSGETAVVAAGVVATSKTEEEDNQPPPNRQDSTKSSSSSSAVIAAARSSLLSRMTTSMMSMRTSSCTTTASSCQHQTTLPRQTSTSSSTTTTTQMMMMMMNAREKEVMYQSLWYLLAYLNSCVPPLITFIVVTTQEDSIVQRRGEGGVYTLLLFFWICHPIQGLLNFWAFIRPRYNAWKTFYKRQQRQEEQLQEEQEGFNDDTMTTTAVSMPSWCRIVYQAVWDDLSSTKKKQSSTRRFHNHNNCYCAASKPKEEEEKEVVPPRHHHSDTTTNKVEEQETPIITDDQMNSTTERTTTTTTTEILSSSKTTSSHPNNDEALLDA